MKLSSKIIWLALFASALFFGGCIRNDGEAFEAPPDISSARTEYVDTFSTYLETYRFDSLATGGREYVFAGTYQDPVLGKLSTAGYFQFLPESYPLAYPGEILEEYTKATITLQYDNVYGKFGTDQFGLYRLNDILPGNRTLFAFENPPSHEPTPYLNTRNGVRVNKLIRIDAGSLGKDIVRKWKETGSFTSDQQFLSYWKGFALRSLDSVPQVTRFDLQYNTDAAPAFLEIAYRLVTNGDTNLRTLKFRTNTSTVQFYSAAPDYQGTPWQSIPLKGGLPAVQSNEKSVMQGLGGLTVKLRIPGLGTWKQKQTRRIKVFKAELEIKPDDPGSLPAPEYLRISSRPDYFMPNENDRSTLVFNDEEIFSLLQQGIVSREVAKNQAQSRLFPYTSSSNVYRCNITGHIQDILDGNVSSLDLNLYSAQWAITSNRLILPKGSVKLKLYYYPI